MTPWRKLARTAPKLVLLAVSSLLVGHILVTTDFGRVAEILSRSGVKALWVLVPFLAGVSIDTAGWSILLSGLGHRIEHLSLLKLRLSTEAVLLSAPFGTAFAESLKACLLERRFRVPLSDAVVSIGVKKTLLTIALGLYLTTSGVVGYPYLVSASLPLLGRPGLPYFVLAAGAVVGATALVLFAALRGGALARRLHGLLSALPSASLRRAVDARRRRFAEVDGRFGLLTGDRSRIVFTTLLFLLGWFVEAGESFLLLRILDAPITFSQLLAFEATVSLIRSLAVFSPAGLGILDASYLGFFAAMGLPDAASVGAAFLVLKRGKDLFWIVVGYLLLVSHRRSRRRAAQGSWKLGVSQMRWFR